MSDMKREDLRVDITSETGAWEGIRDATDADLAALGYEKRPTCTGCGGSGSVRGGDWIAQDGSRFGDSANTPQWRTCPKCGGSGYGRLVSLDVDVEALLHGVVNALEAANTIGMRSCNPGDHLHYAHHDLLIEQARQVLAALDGEEA